MNTIDFGDNPPAPLESLSYNALKQMWAELRPQTKVPTVRDILIKGVGFVLHDSRRMRAMFEDASKTEQLALRLLSDAGEQGLNLRLLQIEMTRLTELNCQKLLLDLFAKGMLLAASRPISGWRQYNKISFDEQCLTAFMVLLHPSVRDLAHEVPIPNESKSLRVFRQSGEHAELTLSVTPEEVIENLLAVCRTIDAQPLMMTVKGQLRAGAKREMAKITNIDEDYFFAWAELARQLQVVDVDDDGHWRRGFLAPKLINEPLTVLSLFPATIHSSLSSVFNFDRSAPMLFRQPGFGLGGDPSSLRANLGVDLFSILSAAANSFSHPGHWFTDDDMTSLLRSRVRKWAYNKAQDPYSFYQPSISITAIMDFTHYQVTRFLNALARLGIVERARHREHRLSRFTRIGAWVFRFGKTYIEDQSFIPGLEGSFSWKNNQLELTHEADTAIVSLAIDKLGERTSERSFHINGETALRVGKGGVVPLAILVQLNDLVPGGPPEAVKQEVDEALRQFQPVVVKPNISVISVADMDNNQISEVSKLGLRVGDFIMIDPVGESQFKAFSDPMHDIDYDKPPRPSCTLSNELEITFHDGKPHDLRLRQFLKDIGAGDGLQPHFDPSRIPGFDSLSEKAATRRLAKLVADLAPHLIQGFSDAAKIRLTAMAGFAEAPRLEDYVVLFFPPEAAKGLVQLKVLGEEVELLSKGRLLVPRRSLQAVEEGLSELGIPFPAEHSTLLETGRSRVALERLEEAAAILELPSQE